MTILAVDTSCYQASAAVVVNGRCLAERFADTDRRHAESVLPLIDETLAAAEQTLSDVDAFAVDIGPGSFTGVRIGVSVVNALAAATGKPVIPVDALRVLYEGAKDPSLPTLVLIDAGNGNAYGAVYQKDEIIIQPSALTIQEAMKLPGADGRILGDTTMEKQYPNARLTGIAAEKRKALASDAASPLYLRPSQAERLFQKRMEAKKG